MAAALVPGPSAVAQAAPDRVVALGGAITEILYDLHLENRLVGVDATSLYPPEALQQKPNVGYVRTLSAEGILSAKPDLVLAIQGAGPKDALDLVAQSGVRFMTIADDPSPDGVVDKIRMLGKAFGAEGAAADLTTAVQARFKALDAVRATVKAPKRVLFLLSLQNGRSMVGGSDTAADGIIRLAGGVNAASDLTGYKTISDEAITAAAPDVILTMQNGGHSITPETVFDLPPYKATPAAQSRALVAMDGLLLLGFGPRTPAAAMELLQRLYPGSAKPSP